MCKRPVLGTMATGQSVESQGITFVCLSLVDGRWLSWSSWGSCSKTCGGGSQQRQRMCEGPYFGGEPCPGERGELRRCNEKRCPGQWVKTNMADIQFSGSTQNSSIQIQLDQRKPINTLIQCTKICNQVSVSSFQNPMRSVRRRLTVMLCGREPQQEIWLPWPALQIPQVQYINTCIPFFWKDTHALHMFK